jgi:2-polyprenyl-3-methyl-5-hydroxy-6-metoxy-1,4-benzoquinol methylase
MKVGGILWNFHRMKAKLKSALLGEIYFYKYDSGVAYHWQHYYERKTSFYVSMVQTVKDMVPINSRVLDLGCGDGLIANVLSEEKECTVFGIDSNPLAISLAKRNNRNNNSFFVRSIYGSYPANGFNVVLAVEVFEHLRKPEVLLKNARNALQEKGILIVTTPLKQAERPVSVLHHKEYTKEEFHHQIEKYFIPEESRLITDPNSKINNCYMLKCKKLI